MRLIRWTALLVAFLLALYVVGWFLVANVAGQQVDRVIERLARAGIDVETTEQGFEGLTDLGFRFQLTDATYASETYGASVSTPGKTQAGVNLLDPNTLSLNVPAGSQIQSPLILGELGEVNAQVSATFDREVEAVAISMDTMTLTALGGLVAMSGDGFDLSYQADGRFSATANLDVVQVVEFMKELIDKRLPQSLVLPEEPVALVFSGQLYPAGLRLGTGDVGAWFGNGGYLVIDRLNMPFHEKLLTPHKGLMFSDKAGVMRSILCPLQCEQGDCGPTMVLRNQSVVDASVVATLTLPSRYQGLAADALCEAL